MLTLNPKQFIVKMSFLDFRRSPDSKVPGANMGPIWGRQDPGGRMLAPWNLLSGPFISNRIAALEYNDLYVGKG